MSFLSFSPRLWGIENDHGRNEPVLNVEGMKTQIPMRLEVRPTEAGPSTVKMAIGNLA